MRDVSELAEEYFSRGADRMNAAETRLLFAYLEDYGQSDQEWGGLEWTSKLVTGVTRDSPVKDLKKMLGVAWHWRDDDSAGVHHLDGYLQAYMKKYKKGWKAVAEFRKEYVEIIYSYQGPCESREELAEYIASTKIPSYALAVSESACLGKKAKAKKRGAQPPYFSKMTIQQLREHARENGINLRGETVKAKLVAAILKAHDEAYLKAYRRGGGSQNSRGRIRD